MEGLIYMYTIEPRNYNNDIVLIAASCELLSAKTDIYMNNVFVCMYCLPPSLSRSFFYTWCCISKTRYVRYPVNLPDIGRTSTRGVREITTTTRKRTAE
jgi:hypothetical protein